ncbi:MAG: HNH endonuclease [Bacteroidota bacterium]
MRSVLVLNADFTPLTVCSVERAFMLLYLEKADMVVDIKDKALRSITESFAFPSVVKIKRYVSVPYKGVVLNKQNIFKRDNGSCQYCGTTKNLTIDHVIPRSKGGQSTWNNLVTACQKCNSRKSDYTLEKVGMELRSKPQKPSYLSFLKMNTGNMREDWRPFLQKGRASA